MCDAGDAELPDAEPLRPVFSRRVVLLAAGAAIGASAIGRELVAPSTSALAAGTYLRPCGNVPISSSWQGHRNRNPPSAEPGTDYAVVTGSQVRAATNGVIVDRKDSTTTATGRYLALRADDGNYIRYLHLQSSTVPLGARVSRGQVIAYSGASGFGTDTGYGPHVHVSLWIGGTPLQLGFANSVDFENYVDPSPYPPPPEDPVPLHKSTKYTWNAALPNGVWAKMPVAADSSWLAESSAAIKETGDLTIYLTATGVTSGFQIRVLAQGLDSSGNVISTSPQPVVEVKPTAQTAASSLTYGEYSLPYFLSGPLRLYAQVRALNQGIRIQQVVVKKNYWQS
ncbi:M23 family metallopeptidase [Microbacterium sp. 1.5R]|uniref:M23 family metallopeptidase n=1 Tax=Microbacterium sp. 1.5R TaxID=1916917 RepID=UPI0016436131|nr:M23 family metallopeptidase [Microbacterium sp. 1.5R]